jgi:hypothetical protein
MTSEERKALERQQRAIEQMLAMANLGKAHLTGEQLAILVAAANDLAPRLRVEPALLLAWIVTGHVLNGMLVQIEAQLTPGEPMPDWARRLQSEILGEEMPADLAGGPVKNRDDMEIRARRAGILLASS